MLHSITYVSECTLSVADGCSAAREITLAAERRNPEYGVTGALIYTGRYFAQYLEGEETQIEALFSRIRLDRRHRNIALLQGGPVPARTFEDWSMVYSGPSSWLNTFMEDLFRSIASCSPQGHTTDPTALIRQEFEASRRRLESAVAK